ncbi:MAG: hypothetical protein WCI43_07390 [Candidatus Firestonebacteria bacterium]
MSKVISQNDKKVLGELGKKYREAAELSAHKETMRLWKKLNGLKPERPMVTIDQLPWNELNINGELDLRCEDRYLREVEFSLRRELYQWNHFPVDMYLEPFVKCNLVIEGISFGLKVDENVAVTDATSAVLGHSYIDQIKDESDLEKIQMPDPRLNKAETESRYELLSGIFKDIIPVKKIGYSCDLHVWDRIVEFKSPESILMDIIDRPEFLHKLTKRFFDWFNTLHTLLEERGLLGEGFKLIHCTGAFTDELPKPGFNPEQPRLTDNWIMAAAQIFSTVSPEMHDEFEIAYNKPAIERFGLGYYGCCEPLDRKIGIIKKIKNVRKISISPWAEKQRSAEAIGRDYVFSNKPTPAFLAPPDFHLDQVQADIKETIDICKRSQTPLEIVLKDVSTVNYKPERLTQWADMVMKLVKS